MKEKGKTKMKEQNSRTKGQRGAERVSKERFRLPRPCYVILDPKGEYFRDFTGSTPAALHSFTDSFFNAWKLYDPDEARELKKRVLEWLIEKDGVKDVPRDYLRVAEVACRTIADGEDGQAEVAGGHGKAARRNPAECEGVGTDLNCVDENACGRGSADGRYCVNLEATHGTIVEVRARDDEDAGRRANKMWARGKIAMDNLSFREVRIVSAAFLGK